MVIPPASNPVERQQFYAELVRQCMESRQQRFEFYKQLRNYYLFGTADTAGTHYNKIASTVDTLCSFIYSPDSTRFSLHLGAAAPKDEIRKVPPLVHELNDQWRMGRNHLVFDVGLKWSFVFGCMIFKGLWRRNMFRAYIVEPHQFGVLREDIPDIEDQEAFVHLYTTTRTQLESDLSESPRKGEILARVGRGTENGASESRLDQGMQRLILSQGIAASQSTSQGGTVEGGIGGNGRAAYDYAPKIAADLIDMYELYVWNDEINDYQMVTMASPDVVVFDRRQPGVRGCSGFTKLAPESNLYDYFWGDSFVARLTTLQEWRTDRVREIRSLLSKQADPPMSYSGFAGIAEEKFEAMRRAGGRISSSMPGAKAESYAPTMPPNTFTELDNIDRMFDDQAGIGHILQGKGESGVRSKGQAELLARLGSARPKKRALVVEEACEDLATLMMRVIQMNSRQRFTALSQKKHDGTGSDGTPLIFIPEQFTNDFEVKVDAHSSSPIFVEDRKNDATQMLEAHAITRERFIEMMDPPNKQLLIEELKGIEAKEEAAAAREAMQQQGQQQAKGARQ